MSAAGEQAPDTEAGRRLILGLGNPGPTYASTRHNFGFLVVDELARRWQRSAREVCRSEFLEDETAGTGGCDLAKPLTFMNRSGLAARCLAQRFGYRPQDVLIVYDEVALPLGTQRLRPGGSPAGHRGVESVVENLRTDRIPRLRLGIAAEGPPPADLAEFVLAPFTEDERHLVSRCVVRAADTCESWLTSGIEPTMNRYNGALSEEE